MREQFITYLQALELRDLGFDEKCLVTESEIGYARNPSSDMGYLPIKGEPYYWRNSKIHPDNCTLPLWQQAFDWFREKHNLYFEIFNSPMYVHHAWKFRTYTIENNRLRNAIISENFGTYQETRLACLIKLISIVKNLHHENRL